MRYRLPEKLGCRSRRVLPSRLKRPESNIPIMSHMHRHACRSARSSQCSALSKSGRCPLSPLLSLLLLAFPGYASGAEDITALPEPVIVLPDALPTRAPATFAFHVKLGNNPLGPRAATLSIICKPAEKVDCGPIRRPVMLADTAAWDVRATVNGGVNSTEIDAQLELDGLSRPGKSRFVNLGLLNDLQALHNEGASDPISSGDTRPVSFWLEDRDGHPIGPSSGIRISVVPLERCVDVKAVTDGTAPETIPYSGPVFKATLDASHPRMTQALYIHAPFWSAGRCILRVTLSAGDDDFGHPESVAVSVRPHMLVVFVMCLLGTFVQFLFAGAVRLVATSKAPTSEPLWQTVFGRNGWRLLEVFVKALAAWIFANLLEVSTLFHFCSVDGSSLLTFGVFGFLVGFWSIQKVVAKLRGMAHGDSETAADDGASTPQTDR